MTTWYSQGFVTAPDGPNAVHALGYDNGGFFGPAFANLGGDLFTIRWTGTDCNCFGGPINFASLGGPGPSPITGAVLTINGVSLDLDAFHNIGLGAWLDGPGQASNLLLRTTYSQSFPLLPMTFGSQYWLDAGVDASDHGVGAASLYDLNHPFPTDMHLTVSHMGPSAVPAVDLATGWPGLALAGIVLIVLARRRSGRS